MTAPEPDGAEEAQWVIEGETDEDVEWIQQQLANSGLEQDDDWVDPTEDKILTALFDAVEDGEVDRIRELLPKLGDCSVDTIGPEGDTLLHLACLYDCVEGARLLLAAGASATVRDEDDGTCLHDAAASGGIEIVQLLLGRAPELVNTADGDGDTPLHNAVRGGHSEIVELLLASGANPNALNAREETPRGCTRDITPELVELLEAAEKSAGAQVAG